MEEKTKVFKKVASEATATTTTAKRETGLVAGSESSRVEGQYTKKAVLIDSRPPV